MGINTISLIAFGVMLLFVGVFVLILQRQKAKTVRPNDQNNITNQKKQAQTNKSSDVKEIKKQDVFKFMEFDKIQDNMIIQKNGEKYTAVLKCKGINYNLMSEVEQLSVEEGFINFLNTLRFPVQLYVQAQNIDLKENLNKYKEGIKNIVSEYDDATNEYNMLINSLESTDEEIDNAEMKKNSAMNVIEYGQDIIRYVEKLSLNKNMLQRNFYVLCSYYKSEITGSTQFSQEELLDICYSELFTRVQNIISGLSMCSVNSEMLNSNALAELLYSSYNRDDSNVINFKDAINSGFHRLYSTSEDAITKKNKMLLENIRKEAEYKAIEALSKAVRDDNIVTVEDIEDNYDQESSKQAIEMIKYEKIDEKIKDKAKKIVINNYKEAKKERIIKKQERLEEELGMAEEKINNHYDETSEEIERENDADNTINVEENNNEEKQSKNSVKEKNNTKKKNAKEEQLNETSSNDEDLIV